MNQKELTPIVAQFIQATNIEAKPLGAGHINDSYLVTADNTQYVLQRINHHIFKNVEQLQNNIIRVTDHLRKKLNEQGVTDTSRRALQFIKAKDGRWFYQDPSGNYWRLMHYITDSVSYDAITPELAEKAGEAFGEFQVMLSDLPGEPLYEIIPNFHSMDLRLAQLREAVKNNAAGRLADVQYLVDEFEKRSEEMIVPERWGREGQFVKRINHCDTKVNNILFDKAGNVLCVVDLDTVMPGMALCDFGDFVRTGANTRPEDEPNTSEIKFDFDIFKAYSAGYLLKVRNSLKPLEIEYLAFGAKLMTYMQAVRFLTDYLNGDTYYKIKHPLHNLERTKAQFRFLERMEADYKLMQDEVQRLVSIT